jgi:hypothetical protein
MRVMVDFQLTSTPKIREMIKENYDLYVLPHTLALSPY